MTSSYQNFLHRRSDVRMLAPATRDALLDDIAKAIAAQGGEIDVVYETPPLHCPPFRSRHPDPLSGFNRRVLNERPAGP